MSGNCPKILAIIPAFIPSTQICVVKPLIRLHQERILNAKITLEYLVRRNDLEWADLIIFCRNTEPRYDWILDFLRQRRIPYIYDIDDNFFEIPLDLEVGRYHRDPKRLAMHTHYLESADLVRVYSDALLEKVRNLNTKVEKVTSPLDWNLISPPRKNSREKKIQIVYATSRLDDRLFPFLISAIHQVLDRYGNCVEIHFWGQKPPMVKDSKRIRHHPVVFNYDRFLRRFSKVGFDIGLAPLMDDEFHRSKTNNKFREYGACRIAGIYSDVEVYSNCIRNGETGLLVSNETGSWYRAMVQLIEDRPLREKIKSQAFEYLQRHYPVNGFEKVWAKQIQSVLTKNGGRLSLPRESDLIWNRNKVRMENCGDAKPLFKRNYFLQGLVRLIWHLKHTGLRFSMRLIKRKLFDRWTVLKFRFFTLPVFGIFHRT